MRLFAVQRAHGRLRIISGATGAVSVVATNGATFYLTGVKLEIGSVATPFNRKSLAESMADCQRYYQVQSGSVSGRSRSDCTAAIYNGAVNIDSLSHSAGQPRLGLQLSPPASQ